jgi:hypothetical protein
MKVVNTQTNKEHNIDKETYDLWTQSGIRLKVIEVEKPKAIKEKELQRVQNDLEEVEK